LHYVAMFPYETLDRVIACTPMYRGVNIVYPDVPQCISM
jgi:hypothetical protein